MDRVSSAAKWDSRGSVARVLSAAKRDSRGRKWLGFVGGQEGLWRERDNRETERLADARGSISLHKMLRSEPTLQRRQVFSTARLHLCPIKEMCVQFTTTKKH